MRKLVAVLLLALCPTAVLAGTTHLLCTFTQADDASRTLIIRAVVASDLNNAELSWWFKGAQCASVTNTCEIHIYKKVTLPTMVRLSPIPNNEPISVTFVVTIDRTTLAAVARSNYKVLKKITHKSYSGTCKAQTEQPKNVISGILKSGMLPSVAVSHNTALKPTPNRYAVRRGLALRWAPKGPFKSAALYGFSRSNICPSFFG